MSFVALIILSAFTIVVTDYIFSLLSERCTLMSHFIDKIKLYRARYYIYNESPEITSYFLNSIKSPEIKEIMMHEHYCKLSESFFMDACLNTNRTGTTFLVKYMLEKGYGVNDLLNDNKLFVKLWENLDTGVSEECLLMLMEKINEVDGNDNDVKTKLTKVFETCFFTKLNTIQINFVKNHVTKVLDWNHTYNGETLLISLCKNHHSVELFECIKYLIKNGANVNYVDKNGNTPLMYLLRGVPVSNDNLIKCFHLLIDNGAILDFKDIDGNNAAMILIKSIIRYQKINEYYEISSNSHIIKLVSHILKVFIEKNLDLNIINNKGNSLLMYLCKSDVFINIIKNLLKDNSNIDINVQNHKGNTPLFFVSKWESNAYNKTNLELVKLFVNKGANVFKNNNKKETILMVTTGKKLLKYFVSLGVDVNAVNNDNISLIMLKTQIPIEYKDVRFLLDTGIDVNVIDKDGRNVLSAFIVNSSSNNYTHLDIVNKMIPLSVPTLNQKDKFGKTTLDYARKKFGSRSRRVRKISSFIDIIS